MTGAAVPGFPSGRATTTTYTDGTTVAAVDGGPAPPGLPATVTTPGGATTATKYFRNGDKAQTTDAAGLVTTYTYDGLGQATATTVVSDSYPAGLVTTTTYDGQGRPLVTSAPPVLNRITGATHTAQTTNTYNVDGALLTQRIIDTSGGDASRDIAITYNTHGQVASESSPVHGTNTFTYDAYGHKATQVDALGGETDFAYDANGHLLTTTLVGYTGDPAPSQQPRAVLQRLRPGRTPGLHRRHDAGGLPPTPTPTTARSSLSPALTRYTAPRSSSRPTCTTRRATSSPARPTTTQRSSTTPRTPPAESSSAVTDPTGAKRSVSYTYSADDRVLSTAIGDRNGTLATADTTYDPLGRTTSTTTHGAVTPIGRWPLTDGTGATAADSFGINPATSTGSIGWSTAHGGSVAITSATSVLRTATRPRHLGQLHRVCLGLPDLHRRDQ